ncbi:MAG: sterol desaturase family protein [Rhodobacteraceae bacterium]|nr:sterol desaturase family protein [Paracoccaceae bacterium]
MMLFPDIGRLVIAFVILFALFRLIEMLRPPSRRLPLLRRGLATDIAYWLFTPFVAKVVTRIAVILAILPIALLAYGRFDAEAIGQGFGPLSRLPLWLQAIGILTLGDFIGYWMHRWFHGRAMWNFHAVHHSSTDLDWLSSVRLHPVNDVLMRLAGTVPVVALGFAPLAVAGIVPFLTLMAILVHARLDWDWGPFRAVFVSPRFHRWHHTDEAAARDTNFAGLLPAWDILFGTYYMPKGQTPSRFGTTTPVPPGLLGQMIFPFLRCPGNGR